MANELAVIDVEPVTQVVALTREGLAAAAEQVKLLQEYFFSTLVEGIDYGNIPGIPKPCLFQPGAITLAQAARVRPHYDLLEGCVVDFTTPLVYYAVRCTLLRMSDGWALGEGMGACSSEERKYKYRSGKENADRAELANTILKMAEKRAFVDAVSKLTGASRFVTQDMEDIRANEEAKPPTATPASAPPVSADKQKVPCPRGCGGFIIAKTVKATGKTFYGCSNFQSALKCRATMTHAEYDIATGGTGEKPVEATKPAPPPEVEPDLAIDTIWRQTWRLQLVPLSLGEDQVRHDLGRLFDGDLDRMPTKYRKRALERMKEMAGQGTTEDPYKDQ